MKTDMFRLVPGKILTNAIRYCSILSIIYIVLIFAVPANLASMHSYHLTTVEYHILLFMLNLPTVLIWFFAFYGVAKLQEYALFIKKTSEGGSLRRLANGANWIAWGLPINAILAIILFGIASNHSGFLPAATIITNYVHLIMPLIGFSIIAQGTLGLTINSEARSRIGRARAMLFLLVSLGVIFCYFTFRQFNLASLTSTHNPYYLPTWLMIISLLIPFLYAWFIGLLAAYEVSSYGQYVRGVLYRQPFQMLASGLALVIVASIALQYIRSLNTRPGALVLDYHVLISYLFRVAIGIGFWLIAYGAIRLRKIEDV